MDHIVSKCKIVRKGENPQSGMIGRAFKKKSAFKLDLERWDCILAKERNGRYSFGENSSN